MPDAPSFRIALLSHVLPPSPSGQATVIQRLFEPLPAGDYFLISRTDYDGPAEDSPGAPRLPAPYRHVPPAPPRRFRIPVRGLLRAWLDARREIRWRSEQVERFLRSERAGVLIACSGDLHDLPAAEAACRRTGVPLVAWMFDDYRYQWTGAARAAARLLEPRVVRRAAALVVPNAAARDEYLRRYGVRATVVGNPCAMPGLAAPAAGPDRLPSDGTRIVYAGSVYHAHFDAFRNLLEAIRRLGRSDVRLHVFTAQSDAELAVGGVCGPAVVRHPHVPPSEVPGILQRADALFLPLAFSSPIPEVIRTSAPGKMGEYLAAGRPILAHAPPGSFVCRYLRENGCGVVVDRDDPSALADALGALIDGEGTQRLGAAARAAAERDFSLAGARAAFREMLESVEAKRHVDR